jgi:hypothetical protein
MPEAAAGAAGDNNLGVLYPLLGATSRRFRGTTVAGLEPGGGWSALAGNSDVFAAARVAAILAGFRNRTGDFVGIDPAVRRGLREIPRLAIGLGGMGAALFAPGEALIDPVAVGLVGDDEDPAVGPRCGPGQKSCAGQKR